MSKHPIILDDGLPATGYLRAEQAISALPISRSQFWLLVKKRGVPSRKISARVTVFLVKDIRELLLGIEERA